MTNIVLAVGQSIIEQCARAGFEVYALPGLDQVRIRDAAAMPRIEHLDPVKDALAIRTELDRAASVSPRMLPQGLTADLNNNRRSILLAIRQREAAEAHAAKVEPESDSREMTPEEKAEAARIKIEQHIADNFGRAQE